MIDRTNVAALIPCYLEERHIRDVATRVRVQLDTVMVIDDGSADRTSEEAKAANVEVIRQEINQGKGAAIKRGLTELGSRDRVEYVLILDGDGQHLPEEIPRFLDEANKTGAAMIVGNRMTDLESMPWVRKQTNLFMSRKISAVCGQLIPDTQCGFRMLRRHLASALIAAPSTRYDFETEMLAIVARLGCRIGAVPVSTVYGDEKSKIHPVRDTIRFFKLLSRLKREAAAGAGQSKT
jgi:glycosyltransferase involved in cell wall biosynthesis